jgi:hypothetical protein
MVWRIKSINHVAIPTREGEWSYDTEATFKNAVRDALADHRMQLISATLPDGSVLDVAELKRRYGPRSGRNILEKKSETPLIDAAPKHPPAGRAVPDAHRPPRALPTRPLVPA